MKYLDTLPYGSVNNARSIVRGKLERFKKFKSEKAQGEVEKVTHDELIGDFMDSDLGNEGHGGSQLPTELNYEG